MNHWNEIFKCTDISVPVRVIIISRGCVEQLNDSMLNKEGLCGLCDELCVLWSFSVLYFTSAPPTVCVSSWSLFQVPVTLPQNEIQRS